MNDIEAAQESYSPSTNQDDAVELKPGETIRAAVAIRPRSYVVKLQPGQAVTVTVSTLSGPIVVKTLSPSGLQIADFNQQQPELLTSPIVIWAEAGGDFSLKVYGPIGECVIGVDPVRTATENDKKRFL